MKLDDLKFEHIEFDAPHEIRNPCRSRVLAGVVMIAAVVALIYLLSG